MWSLKPTLITLASAQAGFAEIYLASGIIAALVAIPIIIFLSRTDKGWWREPSILRNSTLSGIFLGVWYYGFYRALMEAPEIEASIIGFSWVIIATIVMPYLGPKGIQRLTPWQFVLIGVAFGGVVLISISGVNIAQGGDPKELWWAVIAAIGSGLYLPFALRANASLSKRGNLKTVSSMTLVIAVANICSIAFVSGALLLTHAPLDFTSFTGSTYLIAGAIGIGVYFLAEVGWTWGYSTYNSLALGLLPYLVPGVSSLLLWALFGNQLTWLTALGLSIIVSANIVIHLIGEKNPSSASTPS